MKWKVLCIDDVSSNLFTYENILSRVEEIEVITAQSGQEALDQLLVDKIDLILLDIQMPVMDGYEVAKLLKSNNMTKNIPIIFITAIFKKEEFVAKGFALGAIDYLTKPIDDTLLVNRIRLYLDIFTQRDVAQANMQHFYDIAQSVGDGLYVMDINYKVSFINEAALTLLNYRKNELLGQKIHPIIHYRNTQGDFRSHEECEILSLFKHGHILTIDDDVVIKKDGTSLPISLVATPIKHKSNITGVVVLFKDITKQKRLLELEQQKVKSEEEMLLTLVDMLDKRDTYTAGHTARVAKYCELIAKHLGFSAKDIKLLSMAAHLHDIGKVATPDSVLLKPGHLEKDEYEIIKLHLSNGFELLSRLTQYKAIAQIMRHHHERYDGKGYPQGLKANEIPPLARIMIVADAFDAMTTNRIYKRKKSIPQALHEIKSLSAIQFHPEVVEATLITLKDLEIEEYNDQLPKNYIEESRYAYYYKDRLTQLFTIEYLPILIQNSYKDQTLFCYKVELNNFHQFNLQYSWEKGNEVLMNVAKFMRQEYKNAAIFRVKGDDFLMVSPNQLEIQSVQESIVHVLKSDIITVNTSQDSLDTYI